MTVEKVPARLIWALGLTQIVGYGTLYYSFGVLAPAMAEDFGISTDFVFGLLSGALLAGGALAPKAGRWPTATAPAA
nr:MFS transporter [Rhizobium sp. Q54]